MEIQYIGNFLFIYPYCIKRDKFDIITHTKDIET